MRKPKEIYKNIESKIKEISTEIKLPQNINKEVAENIYNSSDQIKEILDNLQSNINDLDKLSEWEHYTISFIGETNAGKSTIIEALRIKYEEEEKKRVYNKNHELFLEEKNLLESLQREEELFNADKQSVTENKTRELNAYLQKAEEFKKSFLFKIRKVFQKNYEPYNIEISTKKKELDSNLNRKFEDIKQVIQNRKRLDTIKFQITYDGEIIGTGRLDYTQTSKAFFIKINNELVKIIDVPGIEGDERKYEEEIKNAVSKSHCVFYVTSSNKTLESGTLSKVKKYIKDQADVFAIMNLRLNSYKEEYYNLSFDEIYKNKLDAIDSISCQFRQELKGNFINIIAINGHWGFLSLSKYLKQEGDKKKMVSDKKKLLNVFQNDSVVYTKSNFEIFENKICETLNQKESKIRKINILKINTLIEKLKEDLQDNLNMYFSTDFLEDIEEQAVVSKKEVNSIYKDFLTNLDNLRKRLVNDFILKSFEAIDTFVQSNDINENVYNIGIKRILNEQSKLLQENLESSLKDSNEEVNNQINKSLIKFLDRLDTLSQRNISFYNPNLDFKFDFLKSDLSKICGVLFSVGGLVSAGASIGAFFGTAIPIPIIGTVSGAVFGAVVGAIAGLIINIVNFFQSTSSKKSKILQKINDELNEQSKKLDKQLQEQFIIISEQVKKDLIDNSLILIDELVDIYQLRKDKITEVIQELENMKIDN